MWIKLLCATMRTKNGKKIRFFIAKLIADTPSRKNDKQWYKSINHNASKQTTIFWFDLVKEIDRTLSIDRRILILHWCVHKYYVLLFLPISSNLSAYIIKSKWNSQSNVCFFSIHKVNETVKWLDMIQN